MGGPIRDGAELADALAKVKGFPLGSDGNPVRAEGAAGQRAYLSRLRCANGQAPAFAASAT